MAHDHRKVNTELAQGILLDAPGFLLGIVERVLQEILEAEMTEQIGAASYERSAARAGPPQRLQAESFKDQGGHPEPVGATGPGGNLLHQALLPLSESYEKALVLALMEMYLEGVSTRKVKEVTEELCETTFSKSLVSSLAGSLDSELSAWRSRRLEAEAYPYLFVDARYEKVRVDGRVVSQGILVVSAVRDDGMREFLAVEVSDTESEATYQELFRSLKRRGLSGVELVVSDDDEGLKSAIDRHFQGASHQRCLLSTTVGTSSAWSEPQSARSWRQTCKRSSPHRLESKPSRCRRIRTTNGLERFN